MSQAERTPTNTEVILAAQASLTANLHTAMPGTVVSYNAAAGTAVIRPGFKRLFAESEAPVDLPLLPSVPVMTIGTAESWVRFPIKAGDTVLLVFAERSIDRWMEQGGQVYPVDFRRHSLSDAVAIPGLRPGQAPAPRGAASSMELVHGRARLELTAEGKVKLGNDFVDLVALLDTILGHLVAATTTNAAVGLPCALSVATVAQLQADKALLQKVKG